MNLIGPKSIVSVLYLVVTIAFWASAGGALLVSIVPIFPHYYGWLRHLSFNAQSGSMSFSVPVFRGGAANWWFWGMELLSRCYNTVFFYLLMRILQPALAGEPFHPRTPNRLRTMGCVVVIGSILRTLACAALVDERTATGFVGRALFALNTDAIFMGIVAIVLAEVFRRGYALKTESELTV